jgi:DNA-directed RNA polymerase specialized sigma24 family protein
VNCFIELAAVFVLLSAHQNNSGESIEHPNSTTTNHGNVIAWERGSLHVTGEQTMIEQEFESYELFRRAIVQRDSDAWIHLYARYRSLLISWAYRTSASEQIGETCDDIADHAWARAWAALTPERFADFPTLARLLGYLRTCVTTTVIDMIRSRASAERALYSTPSGMDDGPEHGVLADLDRTALWCIALGLLKNQAERVALIESFAYCLPPRAIQARHPELFSDVIAVYCAKRNLLERLHGSHELQRLYEEFIAA